MLPETDVLFGIGIQKNTLYNIVGIQIDNYSYEEKAHS